MPDLILCRCWMSGKTSLVLTIDATLKRELQLVNRDVIGFRVVTVEGKKLLIGEKIQMGKIAKISTLPVDALPKTRDRA